MNIYLSYTIALPRWVLSYSFCLFPVTGLFFPNVLSLEMIWYPWLMRTFL